MTTSQIASRLRPNEIPTDRLTISSVEKSRCLAVGRVLAMKSTGRSRAPVSSVAASQASPVIEPAGNVCGSFVQVSWLSAESSSWSTVPVTESAGGGGGAGGAAAAGAAGAAGAAASMAAGTGSRSGGGSESSRVPHCILVSATSWTARESWCQTSPSGRIFRSIGGSGFAAGISVLGEKWTSRRCIPFSRMIFPPFAFCSAAWLGPLSTADTSSATRSRSRPRSRRGHTSCLTNPSIGIHLQIPCDASSAAGTPPRRVLIGSIGCIE